MADKYNGGIQQVSPSMAVGFFNKEHPPEKGKKKEKKIVSKESSRFTPDWFLEKVKSVGHFGFVQKLRNFCKNLHGLHTGKPSELIAPFWDTSRLAEIYSDNSMALFLALCSTSGERKALAKLDNFDVQSIFDYLDDSGWPFLDDTAPFSAELKARLETARKSIEEDTVVETPEKSEVSTGSFTYSQDQWERLLSGIDIKDFDWSLPEESTGESQDSSSNH
jgi:hypothetical protein